MSHDQSGAPGPQAWLPGDLPARLAAPAPEPQPSYQPQPAFQPPSGAGPTPQPGYQPQPPFQPPAFASPTPYPGQAPYGQPGYYGPPEPKPTPVVAILSLVFAFLAPIVGLVLAIVALLRGKVDGNGRGLAIAGLVTSLVMTPLYAAVALPLYLHQRELARGEGAHEALDRVSASLAAYDCDGFMATTTPSFQQQLGVGSCGDFELFAQEANSGPVEVGHVPIVDIEVEDDVATVTTRELVAWAEGESPTQQKFEYVVLFRDGTWRVDSVALAD